MSLSLSLSIYVCMYMLFFSWEGDRVSHGCMLDDLERVCVVMRAEFHAWLWPGLLRERNNKEAEEDDDDWVSE